MVQGRVVGFKGICMRRDQGGVWVRNHRLKRTSFPPFFSFSLFKTVFWKSSTLGDEVSAHHCELWPGGKGGGWLGEKRAGEVEKQGSTWLGDRRLRTFFLTHARAHSRSIDLLHVMNPWKVTGPSVMTVGGLKRGDVCLCCERVKNLRSLAMGDRREQQLNAADGRPAKQNKEYEGEQYK